MTKRSKKSTKGTTKPKTRKPKTKPDTSKVSESALFDFLAKRAGGKDKVVTEYVREAVAAMVKRGATFHDLYEKAMMEGWDNILSTLPVKAVLGTPKPAAKGPGRNGDLAKLRASILDKLAGGPTAGMTAAALAKALDADRKRLTRQLAKLAEDGKVKATGSRRNRTYSLA